MVNGERSDGLRTEAVVSGSKRKSQSGSSEPRKDGEVDDRTGPLEQVWGQGCPATHTLLSFSEFCLVNAQLPPTFLGRHDQMCMTS